MYSAYRLVSHDDESLYTVQYIVCGIIFMWWNHVFVKPGSESAYSSGSFQE